MSAWNLIKKNVIPYIVLWTIDETSYQSLTIHYCCKDYVIIKFNSRNLSRMKLLQMDVSKRRGEGCFIKQLKEQITDILTSWSAML